MEEEWELGVWITFPAESPCMSFLGSLGEGGKKSITVEDFGGAEVPAWNSE